MKRPIDVAWNFYCSLPVPDRSWAQLLSLIGLASGKQTTVSFESSLKLFRVSQQNQEIWVARRSRIRLFHRGIMGRLDYLQESYSLPDAVVGSGDYVVDCGANIGEFSRGMEMKGAIVHAFEPDPREFLALQKNLRDRGSRAYEMALWSKMGALFFRNANDTGDGSVSETEQSSCDQLFVAGTTLDDWATSHLPEEKLISVLKLEAEGRELDVIQGAIATLSRIKYICADLGEPSATGPTSVPEVVNLLLNQGFEVVSFQKSRCMTVFRNLVLTDGAGSDCSLLSGRKG